MWFSTINFECRLPLLTLHADLQRWTLIMTSESSLQCSLPMLTFHANLRCWLVWTDPSSSADFPECLQLEWFIFNLLFLSFPPPTDFFVNEGILRICFLWPMLPFLYHFLSLFSPLGFLPKLMGCLLLLTTHCPFFFLAELLLMLNWCWAHFDLYWSSCSFSSHTR